MTRHERIARAYGAINRLPRPENVTWRQWKSIREYLIALASHLPNIWPSQETIAGDMGCSMRTVKRAHKLAVLHHLVEVTELPALHGKFGGYQYYLVCLGGNTAGCQIGTRAGGQIGLQRPLLRRETQKTSTSSGLRPDDDGLPPPKNELPERASTKTTRKPGDRTPGRKRNQYPGTCSNDQCDIYVPTGKGFLAGKRVICWQCAFNLDPYRYKPSQYGRKRTIKRQAPML
jgi:hypothetical protein